jgi:glycosidase
MLSSANLTTDRPTFVTHLECGMEGDHYPADAIMTPYIGSHDTQRLLSLADPAAAGVVYNKWPDQGLPVAPGDDEPYQRLGLGLAWTLTLPGAPLLYYGDEYGEFGASDPDNRHMWRPVGERSTAEDALFAMVTKIGAARRASLALRRGDYSTLLAEDSVLAYARHTASDLAVVVLNHGDAPATRTITIPATLPTPPAAFTDALDTEAAPVVVSAGQISVTVPARSAAILLP